MMRARTNSKRRSLGRKVQWAAAMVVPLLTLDAVGAVSIASLFDLSEMFGPARVANLPCNPLGINQKHVWCGKVRIQTRCGVKLCDFDDLRPGDYREVVMNGVDMLEATPQWYARRHNPEEVVIVRCEVPVGSLEIQRSGSYSITKTEYDLGDDFVCRFELRLYCGDSAAEIALVKRDFAEWLKKDYAQSFEEADTAPLRVEFLEYRQNGSAVSGCARVNKISPLSMKYDSETGCGVISVRIGGRRIEEVRQSCIKYIERVVKDKNVARFTSEEPAEAMYFIRNEEIKDDILKIEFATE